MSKNLKSIKDLWKKANTNKSTGTFDEFEDGRYLSIITDATVGESQASNRLQLMIAFKIQEGEYEGKTKRSYIGLDSEMGVQIAVNTLARLGIEVEDPEELEDKLKEAKGKICKIQLKTKSGAKGEFQNVFILKVVGTDASEDVEHGAGATEAVEEPEVEAEEEKPAKKEKAKPAPAVEPAEEVEEEVVEEAGEEVELKIGMKVVFNLAKKEVEGKVTKIEEEKGTAIVEHKGKKYRVACDAISLVQ
jgi:hypothetical protein